MDLFHKVHTLLGALLHKPFMPRPEKAKLNDSPRPSHPHAAHPDRSTLETPELEVIDTGRVADLIQQQKATD